MSEQPLFELDSVSFRYGTVAALSNLSLRIVEGQRLALLGANGSGKSTLLRILDALYFPDSGTVTYRGSPLTETSFLSDEFAIGFRRNVALVFQNPDVQLFCPTVYDEVAFGPLQMQWSKTEIRLRVDAALELLGIVHLKHRAPHHLSGGEKKKVAIASVLVLDPQVILLDEPTAALDPRSQTQIIDFLNNWSAGRKTVITATHDLHMLGDIADECLIMEQGAITARGTPDEVLRDASLLRRANLIHAHHRRHGTMHTHAGHDYEHDRPGS
jgi:cobalt/nickel transport system ATP-binding protein